MELVQVVLFVLMTINIMKNKTSQRLGKIILPYLMNPKNISKRFNVKNCCIDYDAKYIFSDLGYNFIPSEISAAFALEQLKKLKNNIMTRNKKL